VFAWFANFENFEKFARFAQKEGAIMTRDHQIIFRCGNVCKHDTGISHDPALISCDVAELRAWNKRQERTEPPGVPL
jgi:hypothetical protein